MVIAFSSLYIYIYMTKVTEPETPPHMAMHYKHALHGVTLYSHVKFVQPDKF